MPGPGPGNTTPNPTPTVTITGSGAFSADTLNAQINAQPTGARIRLLGTFNLTGAGQIRPRTGQQIFGTQGSPTLINGNSTTGRIFDMKTNPAENVMLSDLRIQNSQARGVTMWKGSNIRRCIIDSCGLGTGTANGESGIGMSGQNIPNMGMIIDTCTISNNGGIPLGFKTGGMKVTELGLPGGESGKFTGSALIVRDCRVFGNFGVGLWCDICCEGILIERNEVFNNARHGIRWEICGSATIQDNLVYNNGTQQDGNGDGINVTGGAFVDVLRNRVYANNADQISVDENLRSDIPGGNTFGGDDVPTKTEPGVVYPEIFTSGHGYATVVHNVKNNDNLNGTQLSPGGPVTISAGQDFVFGNQMDLHVRNVPGGVINYDPRITSPSSQSRTLPLITIPFVTRPIQVTRIDLPAPQQRVLPLVSIPVTVYAFTPVPGQVAPALGLISVPFTTQPMQITAGTPVAQGRILPLISAPVTLFDLGVTGEASQALTVPLVSIPVTVNTLNVTIPPAQPAFVGDRPVRRRSRLDKAVDEGVLLRHPRPRR